MHNGSAKVNRIITRITVILSVVCISVLDTVKYTSGYKYAKFFSTYLNRCQQCNPDVAQMLSFELLLPARSGSATH